MNLLKSAGGLVAPMILFIGLNVVEGNLPANLYPFAYIAKIAIVLLVLGLTAKAWTSAPNGLLRLELGPLQQTDC